MRWSPWASCCMASGFCSMVVAGCAAPPGLDILPGAERHEQSRRSDASPIFDGKRVELRGARGETLGLQVRVSDGRPRTVRLEMPDDAARVTSFTVRALDVREPSTDMYGPSSGAGTYPDVLVPEAGAIRTEHLAYFDVAIRSDVVPGRYSGSLTIDGREVPVELRVG